MSWSLVTEHGVQLEAVISFRIEQSKGKPATLTWELPVTNDIYPSDVSLWRMG